jgi:sugar O-acyltransferase (sialic acid O-acetyltransferase NeuD family)
MMAGSSTSPTGRPRGAIVGAGAQGRVIAAVWRRAEPHRELVFLDDDSKLHDARVEGIKVLGPVEMTCGAHLAIEVIIAIGNNHTRTRLAETLRGFSVHFANVVDPSAAIMPYAALGVGIFVGPQAVIHTGARIGDHAVINTAAIIEHDCILAAGANVAPGVRMGGRVVIEENAFISTGATLVPRVVIGQNAVVGAGAVVTRNIPKDCVAYGCPARVIRQVTEQDWARLL